MFLRPECLTPCAKARNSVRWTFCPPDYVHENASLAKCGQVRTTNNNRSDGERGIRPAWLVASLTNEAVQSKLQGMGLAQIIEELPKLTSADRTEVRRKLMELADQNDEIALCDAMALEGAQTLDRLEAQSGEPE